LTREAAGIVVANAPVSYGAFEVTVGIDPNVPDASMVLDEVAGAGYAAIDLGPAGYFGDRDTLGSALESRGLALCGGFFELPFSDPAAMPAAMRGLDELLDLFDAAPARDGAFKPKPTLADAGSDLRRSRPFQAARDHSLGLDADGWKRFAQGVEMAVARCRERGYEPTLHYEAGTHVEAPWEISAALEHTSIGLCLDTGHLMLGGGDPVRAIEEWGDRINHVHFKDAHKAVVEGIIREKAPAYEIWTRHAFCRLGDGDLDVNAVLDWLRHNYTGWLVVEQDVLPDPDRMSGRPALDQRANREFLRARGF
jgi:inosose dehydratase